MKREKSFSKIIKGIDCILPQSLYMDKIPKIQMYQ